MRFDILSLFPHYFFSPFDVSIIKRARQKQIIQIGLVDIRSFSQEKHQKVDNRPYGGGPGMVLMPDPVAKALRSVKKNISRVIYLSPQGERLTAKKCKYLASEEHIVLLCGHYEGIDQRVLDLEVDEEISVGDFVLTSGAPAAVILVDAVSRFIPGVIGNEQTVSQDSFENGLFDAPVYTRPSVFEDFKVPSVLMKGNHSEIARWRASIAYKKTKNVRPDLIKDLISKEKQQ